ncbi:hypothetical protein [Roseinatronobacter sp. S2]|uniref:hypothetical protein n=1 Tax=Roseinatronobacter sp. S2 TaxID=3035471 RepID=UPI00240F3591|nr:hypothetical protein [Roseinatronobacter sp. S2]WFE76905.1 hypothetical protein P8S53_17840 [Roseinatronobacter sp. S2]
MIRVKNFARIHFVYAITGSDGRFRFRDIYRRPRVVQMDVTTLLPGARPVLCYASTRSAVSQFVELRPVLVERPFGFAPTGTVRRSSPASERAPQSTVTATVQDDGRSWWCWCLCLKGAQRG